MIISEVLNAIDNIDSITQESELNVCLALTNSYDKAAMIMENYDGDDVNGFSIFQESGIMDNVKERGKDMNTFMKIISFIPRLVMAIIDNIKSKFNKKDLATAKENNKKLKKIPKEAKIAVATAAGIAVVGGATAGVINHKNKHKKDNAEEENPIEQDQSDESLAEETNDSSTDTKDSTPVDDKKDEKKESKSKPESKPEEVKPEPSIKKSEEKSSNNKPNKPKKADSGEESSSAKATRLKEEAKAKKEAEQKRQNAELERLKKEAEEKKKKIAQAFSKIGKKKLASFGDSTYWIEFDPAVNDFVVDKSIVMRYCLMVVSVTYGVPNAIKEILSNRGMDTYSRDDFFAWLGAFYFDEDTEIDYRAAKSLKSIYATLFRNDYGEKIQLDKLIEACEEFTNFKYDYNEYLKMVNDSKFTEKVNKLDDWYQRWIADANAYVKDAAPMLQEFVSLMNNWIKSYNVIARELQEAEYKPIREIENI